MRALTARNMVENIFVVLIIILFAFFLATKILPLFDPPGYRWTISADDVAYNCWSYSIDSGGRSEGGLSLYCYASRLHPRDTVVIHGIHSIQISPYKE